MLLSRRCLGAGAAAAAPRSSQSGGATAADYYDQAAALYNHLSDDEKLMLSPPRDLSDEEAAKMNPIMELLREARRADYVDWRTGPAPFKDIPSEERRTEERYNLSNMAVWDSEYRFKSDPKAAVSDIAAMEAMDRRLVDSWNAVVIEAGYHMMGLRSLARNANLIRPESETELAFIVSPAAVEESFEKGANADSARIQAQVSAYTNPATRGDMASKMRFYLNWAIASGNSVSPEQVISDLKWTAQTDAVFAATLKDSNTQFHETWSDIQKIAASKATPVARGSFVAMPTIRLFAQEESAMGRMLEAGVALERHDQAKFQSILDPITGKPFTLTETSNGFQLGSALRDDKGKAVLLDFPAPAAK
jgi:hypothetical protein